MYVNKEEMNFFLLSSLYPFKYPLQLFQHIFKIKQIFRNLITSTNVQSCMHIMVNCVCGFSATIAKNTFLPNENFSPWYKMELAYMLCALIYTHWPRYFPLNSRYIPKEKQRIACRFILFTILYAFLCPKAKEKNEMKFSKHRNSSQNDYFMKLKKKSRSGKVFLIVPVRS